MSLHEAAPTPHRASDIDKAHDVHAVSPLILLGTFGALLVLTVLTVAVTYVDLGPLSIWIALGIAFLKAALVGLFFMHLLWDNRFNAVILVSALLFVAIFIGVSLLDTHNYRPYFAPPPSAGVR